MTVYPTHTDFIPRTAPLNRVMIRPNVTEHYWGYEVRTNEQVVNIAVLLRAVCGVLTIATVGAALGVWLVPAMAFVGSTFLMKATVSVLLVCVAVVLARVAARGTRIRVQIDRARGELREVVDGPLGSVFVVARYGLDAIEGIDIVPSTTEPSFGQVQVLIKDLGAIAVGDGAIVTLRPLLDRVAYDCGIDDMGVAIPATWSGPLAA